MRCIRSELRTESSNQHMQNRPESPSQNIAFRAGRQARISVDPRRTNRYGEQEAAGADTVRRDLPQKYHAIGTPAVLHCMLMTECALVIVRQRGRRAPAAVHGGLPGRNHPKSGKAVPCGDGARLFDFRHCYSRCY
ncbi:hypothetical protein MTO96_003213 [Rhipicephalus appendiculatus]